MSDTLVVEVNRDRSRALEVPTSFEATGSFAVRFRNRGEPIHVYLNLDDALASVAALPTTNHYLDAGETVDVPIEVTGDVSDEPVEGSLQLVTRYGASEHRVEVTLDGSGESDVPVDPDLGTPRPEPEPSPVTDRLPALVLAGAGVVVLAVAAFRADLLVGAVGVVLFFVAGAYVAISR